MTSLDERDSTETTDLTPPAPPWLRVVVAAGAVIAVLLLGASLGLVAGGQLEDGPGSVPAADSVDVGFSQDMVVHHQQAVVMAGLARQRAGTIELRTLAYDMETTQLNQIGRMQGYLSLWDQASLPTGDHMRWMTGAAGVAHHGGGAGGSAGRAVMPGMASNEDLERLRAAGGDEFDVLFLQLMIRHHQGGEGMLDYAGQFAATPQLRALASQMLAAQQRENVYMTDLLAGYGADALPPPT